MNSAVLALILVLLASAAVQSRRTSSSSDCDEKGCSHDCEMLGEFPLCVCPPEMALDRDGKTCKDTTSFLLAMFRGIRLYNEESEEEVTLTPSKAGCLDFHYGRKELYAYTNYTIMRYPLSKGKTASPVSMITQTDTAVTSLAVDWVHDVIYYISEQQEALSVTSLEGGPQRTVLTHNDSSTSGWRSLVVDPNAKKLFWIGNKGVYSFDLEEEEITTDVISGVKPDRIALDTKNQLIYAIGRKGGNSNKYITRAMYNGTKSGEDIEISQPASVEIFGFGVVGSTAYWESNHDGENIYKCNLNEVGKTGKAKVTLVAEINQIVYDMKVYQQDVQKTLKHRKRSIFLFRKQKH